MSVLLPVSCLAELTSRSSFYGANFNELISTTKLLRNMDILEVTVLILLYTERVSGESVSNTLVKVAKLLILIWDMYIYLYYNWTYTGGCNTTNFMYCDYTLIQGVL